MDEHPVETRQAVHAESALQIPAPVHFLHIRKTGGTAIKAALKPAAGTFGIVLHDHSFTLGDVPAGHGAFFSIRDPVGRFVSGFNDRLRKGNPRWHVEWNRAEHKAFARFKSANELAEALTASAPQLRERAETSMQKVLHIREKLTGWLGSREAIEARLASIVWIGTQETLKTDFEEIKRRLALPARLGLPADDKGAHKTPEGFSTALSEEGRRNIERWYAADMELYAYLADLRARFASLYPVYVRPVLTGAQAARVAAWSPAKPVKVFGIGFHKTGTKSLAHALRKLRYSVRSAMGINDEGIARNAWDKARALIDDYDAFEDNPWPILYRELYADRPDAKFILTVRPADAWFRSVAGHFGGETTPMREWIYGAGAGNPKGNEARYIERYERHNREVIEFFADKPGSLLIMDFAAGDGWEKLCAFLGEAVPPGPFPHKHSREDRAKRQSQFAAEAAEPASLAMG